MQPKGAWGGGILGLSANRHSSSPALEDGEEACTICHERRLEICIIPCKHRFCQECITCLRKANVFKVS